MLAASLNAFFVLLYLVAPPKISTYLLDFTPCKA